MKKRVRILLFVMAALLLLSAYVYLTPKTFAEKVNPSDVDHINVFDGNTGLSFTITNPDKIQYIVDNLQSHPMRKNGCSLGYMGYTFQISLINDKDKDVIPLFFLNSEDTIRKDPFFYTCEGGLCFDYIKALETELADK